MAFGPRWTLAHWTRCDVCVDSLCRFGPLRTTSAPTAKRLVHGLLVRLLIRVFVDKKRSVVLRARYWDDAGVAVKELSTAAAKVREFDGVWVPMYTTMRNLLLESHTRLIVTDLTPNPNLSQSTFDLGRLESH